MWRSWSYCYKVSKQRRKIRKEEWKVKRKADFKRYKDYKDKGNQSCYMAKDFDSSEEDEVVYIVVKDESDDENEKWVSSLMLVRMIHGLFIVVILTTWLVINLNLSTWNTKMVGVSNLEVMNLVMWKEKVVLH